MNLISIIIPVKNGEATLAKCLNAISQQAVAEKIEIIILDSMSTDNSRNIALSYGAKIIDIPNGTFNHGLTRNKGVEVSNGDLIYFTVQDAYLAEDDQLERMSAHFKDEEVQSVTGIQGIPSDKDKNPAIWFKRFSKPIPEVRQFKDDSFQNLSTEEKLVNSRWDDVNAMYRKTALQHLPFKETDFAEDALWAMNALESGWKIIRDSSLVVYHYHHRNYSYSYKLTYTVNYHFYKYFGCVPKFPSIILPVTKATYHLLKNKRLNLKEKFYWITYNFLDRFGNFVSDIDFLLRLNIKGVNGVTKKYNKVCKNIPQGLQRECCNE